MPTQRARRMGSNGANGAQIGLQMSWKSSFEEMHESQSSTIVGALLLFIVFFLSFPQRSSPVSFSSLHRSSSTPQTCSKFAGSLPSTHTLFFFPKAPAPMPCSTCSRSRVRQPPIFITALPPQSQAPGHLHRKLHRPPPLLLPPPPSLFIISLTSELERISHCSPFSANSQSSSSASSLSQYPLGMGMKDEKPDSKIFPLTVDSQGNVAVDANVKQNENVSKIVYSQHEDLVPKVVSEEEKHEVELEKDMKAMGLPRC